MAIEGIRTAACLEGHAIHDPLDALRRLHRIPFEGGVPRWMSTHRP